jgi:hypothetical protein
MEADPEPIKMAIVSILAARRPRERESRPETGTNRAGVKALVAAPDISRFSMTD